MSTPRNLAQKCDRFWQHIHTLPDDVQSEITLLIRHVTIDTVYSGRRALNKYGEYATNGRLFSNWKKFRSRHYEINGGDMFSKEYFQRNIAPKKSRKRLFAYAKQIGFPTYWRDGRENNFFWPTRLEWSRKRYIIMYKHIKPREHSSNEFIDRMCLRMAAKAFWLSRNRRAQLEARFGALSESRAYRGAFRSYVLELHKHKCDHCGATDRLEVDHKVPWSKGGRTTIDNARVLCAPCNKGIYHLRQKHQNKKEAA